MDPTITSTLYWTRGSFEELTESQKKGFAGLFVQCNRTPDVKTALVRLVAHALSTSTDNIRMGFMPFDHILKEMIKRDDTPDDNQTPARASSCDRFLNTIFNKRFGKKIFHILTRTAGLVIFLAVVWFASYGVYFLLNFWIHSFVACNHSFYQGPSCNWVRSGPSPIFAFKHENNPFMIDRNSNWSTHSSYVLLANHSPHTKIRGQGLVVPWGPREAGNNFSCVRCAGVNSSLQCIQNWVQNSTQCVVDEY